MNKLVSYMYDRGYVMFPELAKEDELLDELIASHIRQREGIVDAVEQNMRSNQRLWFVPLRLRRWMQGYL